MKPGADASSSISGTAASQKLAAPSASANVAWSTRMAPAASGPSPPSGPCWVARMLGAMAVPGMATMAAMASGGGGAVSSSVMIGSDGYHPTKNILITVILG